MGSIAQNQGERLYTISSVLPKPCYNSFTEEFPVSFAKADEVGPYLLIEYSAQQLCCQLTLLQQVQGLGLLGITNNIYLLTLYSAHFLYHFPTLFQAYFILFHKTLN